MSRTIHAALALFLFLSPAALFAETIVDVSYSYPQIGEGEGPYPDIVEGSIVATFTSNTDMDLLHPDTTVTKVSDREYTYRFPWNWEGEKFVEFLDEFGDTIPVTAFPERVLPLDPAGIHLPVFHIQIDSTALWDPATGIYVWGEHENFLQRGSAWEREGDVDFYDMNDSLVFSKEIGLRINGQGTRYVAQKGLRFYFDHFGAADHVSYDFFGSEPIDFRRVVLRTNRYASNMINSNVVEGLFRDRGHLASRFSPVVVFLNNEFWGCYDLRERLDEEFVEFTHDLDGSDYVLIKDGESEHGDVQEWNDFLYSFDDPIDPAAHDWFLDVSSNLDLESYIDWRFLNIFFATSDNGFVHNVAQLRVENDPWKIIMWDEDNTFVPANLDADYFRFFAAEDSAEFAQYLPPQSYWTWSPNLQIWCTMFNRLMRNSEFKAVFYERVDSLLAGPMTVDSLTARINDLVALWQPDTDEHADRWGWWSPAQLVNVANTRIQWVADRYPIIQTQYAAFKEHFRAPVELSRFTATPGGNTVTLDWRTESERDNAGFVIYRSIGSPDNMVEIASYLDYPELTGQAYTDDPTEYEFVDSTAVPNRANHYMLHHVDTGDSVIVHDWTEMAWPASWDGLVINELMAKNETTIADGASDFDDWFEFYNGGADTIYLDSIWITDDLGDPRAHHMTGGLFIPPGGCLLLWADDETEEGHDHCAFKLSADGEEIGLFEPDGVTLIDSVRFGGQIADVAYARYPDGGPDWFYSSTATPGAANVEPNTGLLLMLNEVLADNETVLADESAEYDPWVEIHNPLPIELDMNGLFLTDSVSAPEAWAFPDTTIDAGGYLLVWVDGDTGEGMLHADFTIVPSGGFLGLFLGGVSSPADSLTFGEQEADISYARIPDGGDWEFTVNPTPGAMNLGGDPPPVLYINEFLAKNTDVNQDEAGEYEDWIEIYNPGPDPVEMGGMFLTDDLGDSLEWEFPDTVIAAGGYLLVWCDDDPGDGPLHASFKLSQDGEEIGLFSPIASGAQRIDSYVFGPQTQNTSEGREWDGAPQWVFFHPPTPGATNGINTSVDGRAIHGDGLLPNAPNPFNPRTTIRFALAETGDVLLAVHDVRGRLVRRLISEEREAGEAFVLWEGRDDEGRDVPSGVYFTRLKTDRGTWVRRIVLLR